MICSLIRIRLSQQSGQSRIAVSQNNIPGPSSQILKNLRRPRTVTRYIPETDRHINSKADEIVNDGIPCLTITVYL